MADGVVDGDLFVVGGGDPLLTTPGFKASLDDPEQVTEPYADLADALVAAGLTRGPGRHRRRRLAATRPCAGCRRWPTRYQREGFVGPLRP